MNSTQQEQPQDDFYYFRVVLSIAYGLVFVIGLVGNVLVIVAVVRGGRRMRHSVSNIFLANLAVADLIVILFYVSTLIPSTYFDLPRDFGSLCLCKMGPYITTVSLYASAYSLVAVTIERCRYSISAPFYHQLSPRTCMKFVFIIWIVAFILPLPWIFVYLFIPNKYGFMECIQVWPERWMDAAYFSITDLTLGFIVPLFIISICYALIGHYIWSRHIPIGSHLLPSDQQVEKQIQKYLKMIAVVVATFTLAWLPYYIVYYIMFFAWNGSIPLALNLTERQEIVLPYFLPIAVWMACANSCVNPIIYYFLDRNFRLQFRQMVCRSSPEQEGVNRNQIVPMIFIMIVD